MEKKVVVGKDNPGWTLLSEIFFKKSSLLSQLHLN